MQQKKKFYSIFSQFMTVFIRYTFGMTTLFFARGLLACKISTLILSVRAVGGAFCLIFLFSFSFLCVHILKCAKIGFFQSRKKTDSDTKKEEKEKAPAPPQEPVYYIVEKKRARSKPKYGEPKEIRFK
jgi:hypothetical protein